VRIVPGHLVIDGLLEELAVIIRLRLQKDQGLGASSDEKTDSGQANISLDSVKKARITPYRSNESNALHLTLLCTMGAAGSTRHRHGGRGGVQVFQQPSVYKIGLFGGGASGKTVNNAHINNRLISLLIRMFCGLETTVSLPKDLLL